MVPLIPPLVLWLFLFGGLAMAGAMALPNGGWGNVLLLCFGAVVVLLAFGAIARASLTPLRDIRPWELRVLTYLGVISEFDIAVHNARFEERFGLNIYEWVAYGESKEFEEDIAGNPKAGAEAFTRSWNRWNAERGGGYAAIDEGSMETFLHLLDKS